MRVIQTCSLTDISFDQDEQYEKLFTDKRATRYKFYPIGIAHISELALISIRTRPDRHMIAGLCRNFFLNNEEPPIITNELLDTNYIKTYELPENRKAKGLHLLKYIYNNGGDDLEKFTFYWADYTIAYAKNHNEFNDIIKYLEDQYWIEIGHRTTVINNRTTYEDITLTDLGIDYVQKDLPPIPLIGLVEQKISTGDLLIDEKIIHAKKLFFSSDSIDNKRSACETLSFVLEPLRNQLTNLFTNRDTQDFFQIVNQFDIRHNKEYTKSLEFPEQLEWVFYRVV